MQDDDFFRNTPAPFLFVLLPIKDISRVLKCEDVFMLEVTLLKGNLKRGGGQKPGGQQDGYAAE